MDNDVKKYIIIFIYSLITFIWGIHHTKSVLMEDIKAGDMEYGRVDLRYSYWYEHYYPRKLITAWKNKEELPVVFPLIDRAASPLYWKKYSR